LNDRFPAKAPFPTASHSGADNARRTSTQIKQGSTLVAIFLRGIRSVVFAFVEECFPN